MRKAVIDFDEVERIICGMMPPIFLMSEDARPGEAEINRVWEIYEETRFFAIYNWDKHQRG